MLTTLDLWRLRMKIIKTTDYKTFCQMVGANLRYCRNKKILTQKSIGERIDITHQQVQKYESGVSCCSAFRLDQMAKIYEVPVTKLLDPDFIMNECNKKNIFIKAHIDEHLSNADYEHERRILNR